MSNYHKFLVAVLVLVWLWAAYKPLFPHDWLLENILVLVFAAAVIFFGRYFKLSDASYTLLTLFLILHVVATHYTYEEVPIGRFFQEVFDSQRNMYDRFVHFSFGLMIAYPIREIFMRVAKSKGFWSFYIPVELIIGLSAVYEILEWLAVINVSPAAGIAFLGAQGDEWDAQKDMAVATLGAVTAMTFVFLRSYCADKGFMSEFKKSFGILVNGDSANSQ